MEEYSWKMCVKYQFFVLDCLEERHLTSLQGFVFSEYPSVKGFPSACPMMAVPPHMNDSALDCKDLSALQGLRNIGKVENRTPAVPLRQLHCVGVWRGESVQVIQARSAHRLSAAAQIWSGIAVKSPQRSNRWFGPRQTPRRFVQ